jgi:alanyl-tRNA synthetase
MPEVELRDGAPAAAAELVLDRTPFYAEGGGQVGDIGRLVAGDAKTTLFSVDDTVRAAAGVIVHRGRLHGRLAVGDTVRAEVDADRRGRAMRNHTGTHVLHRALRNVVGERARQAGSLVHPDYLRFDFPFDRALTDDEIKSIEDEVRRTIREDRPVTIEWMTMADAQAAGADAFFDEKYGELVRTIRVEDYSHELCGGTHCRSSGQIGSFVITGEHSIGSGQRRIEALTGEGADAFIGGRLDLLERLAEQVGATSVDALTDRVATLQEELRDTRRRLKAGAAGGLPRPADLAKTAETLGDGIRIVAFAGPYESIDALKGAAKDVRGILGSGVVAMALDAPEPQIFVTVSDDLVARGLSAGALVKAATPAIDGRGGGRPEMAQGKGSRQDGVGDALAAVRSAVAEVAG